METAELMAYLIAGMMVALVVGVIVGIDIGRRSMQQKVILRTNRNELTRKKEGE